ncbi:Probable carotenoid cleavage dioxygenase 4, chloroplastic [Linum perenne]
MVFGGGSPVGADPNKVPRVGIIPRYATDESGIDLKTGEVSRVLISVRNLDFGVVNPGYVGRKNRFVYAGVGDPMPKISGVVKLDVGDEMGRERRESTVACRMFTTR